MSIKLSIPRYLRQYMLERLLSEGASLRDICQDDHYLFTFQEALPASLVFRAYHVDLKLDVALRVIPLPGDDSGSEMAEKLRDLVRRMWEFRHEHIVNIIDYAVAPHITCTEESADGGSRELPLQLHLFVAEYLKGRQQLTEALGPANNISEHINLLSQALSALQYAHRHEVRHGRLHPGNLIVEIRRGQLFLRITDFGHHMIDQMGQLPTEYHPYIHPAHHNQPTVPADLYALANVFYRALTGEEPSHDTEAMAGRLRRRYQATFPHLVRAMEAAWSLESSAGEMLRILSAPRPRVLAPFQLSLTTLEEQAYHLRAACPLTGEVSARIKLKSLAPGIKQARELLRQEQRLPEELKSLPGQLLERLLPPQVAVHLGLARERACRQGQTDGEWCLPLLLDLSASTELAEWPWEIMLDDRNYLSLDVNMPFLRVLDSPHPDGNRHLTRPLSLMVISSQPLERAELNVVGELAKLEQALSWMGRYHYDYSWVSSGTWQDVRSTLAEKRPNVVHFIGHGRINPITDEGELSFCDADGMEDPVSARDLAMLFKDHGIELLFLNACDSAQVPEESPAATVAVSLLKQGIPNVLAMQFPIDDEASILLTETFYRALMNDRSFAEALTEARLALHSRWRGKMKWATPIMYVS